MSNPQLLTEKLQWLKLYDRKGSYSHYVDKYEVKKIVSERIGEKYVIPLYGVWKNFEDIDFDTLPDSFVLKCTHDSGGFYVCKNKTDMDYKSAKKILNQSLKRNYYWFAREWSYKNIIPRIIAERYEPSLGGADSVEYKITCMNGKVKMITVCTGIPHTYRRLRKNDHFDKNWNKLDFYAIYEGSGKTINKPPFMDEMVILSEKLAKDIPYLRVDWYYIDGNIYFGEMTFYTHGGYMEFNPDEWDGILGSWLELPCKK